MSIKKTYIPAKPRSSKLVGTSMSGGVSGGVGGTGGGGGITSSQLKMLTNLADWWRLDEENDAIYSEKSVYSLKGVSALGLGEDGSGGGGGVDMLDSWANYTEAKADFYAPASLLVPFRNDTLSRLASLEAGGGATDIEIGVTGSGNAVTGVSKSGNTLNFAKGSTFSLATHNHDTIYKPIGYVPSWSEITNKPSTFTPSAHTHTIANVTGLQDALNLKAPLASPTFTGNVTAPTFIGALSGNASSATKLQTAQWIVEQVGTELVFKYNGVIKQRMLSNGTILATGGMTALTT